MLLEYSSITKPKDCLKAIAKQLEVKVVNNEMQLPKKLGKGFFKQYYPFEWLTISYIKCKVYEPLEVVRIGVSDQPLTSIIFYLSEGLQFIDNTDYQIGNDTVNGIFMSSPNKNSKWVFCTDTSIVNITFIFDQEWILNEILEQDSYLHSLFTKEKYFCIFESFTKELSELINELQQTVSSYKIRKLHFYSLLMQILDKFFLQLNEREYYQRKSRIYNKDIAELFKVRQLIFDNISSLPKISLIAEEVGMSVSKLQKSFKQFFGKSMSQYALSCKMEKARRMLTTRKHSISDVAYILGYTNISNFSKSFRKYFGVSPTGLLNSLNLK